MNTYMQLFKLSFAYDELEEEKKNLDIKVARLEKKISELHEMNRKLHSKLREERALKEKILREQNAEKAEETQFGLISKFAPSSNAKEKTSPSSAQSNSCLDTDDPGHKSNQSNSSGSNSHKGRTEIGTSTTSQALEKVNKGCQCGPNGTSWISSEDLELVMQNLDHHQSNLLRSCLHSIEDIPAAAVTQVPALSTPRTASSKKSKKSKSVFNVNDVD